MRFVVAFALLAACRPPGYGKDEVPDAAESTGDASGSAVDAAIDAPVALCEHSFRLDGRATASSVWLTGDFVSWAGDPQAGAVAFTLGIDGGWTGSYSFMAGTYQYKFIVNGTEWIPDPTNPSQADDGFGGKNSLYVCAP